ncbi:hypothetical protein RJ640_013275 [Escallonia rubra]|uniref:Uncharacterized protein n=1 Tax=Escallonia rubra TaxID=112253 RepID=A0AA88RC16_9ASTE|nr:hypothetical protein RJ640_013275 [Escallonia rubra]
MKFMLNEQELEEHLTKEMVAPTEAQPLRDHTAYQKWNQKDRSARYTLLSSLQNDLIGQYDELPTCKALWEQLKFTFGGTSTMRLRSLMIKFEEYTKDPKHTMSEHLRVMSNMIGFVMYGEHPNGGRTEIESRDVDFIESDFPGIGDASKNLDLYELEEVEPTLPSPSEGGELVHHPVVAEDSVSDLQPSESIPDSGSIPQGPLGQQDSQLRRDGNAMSSIVATKKWLSSTFEMKDMGEANYVLGVKIVRDRSKRLLGEVSMKHIPTGRIVADPLTKPIARDVFLSHIRSMGLRRHYESDWAEKLRLCHEEDILVVATLACILGSWNDAVSQRMSRKAVESNWNDMRALGRKSNITPCYVIHSLVDFVDFGFDMSHEYITYERFNTTRYEGFESV